MTHKRIVLSCEVPDVFDHAIYAWCDQCGIGHVGDVPVHTAILRLHAAFPWMSERGLAVLAANQTGRDINVIKSAVARLKTLGRLKE